MKLLKSTFLVFTLLFSVNVFGQIFIESEGGEAVTPEVTTPEVKVETPTISAPAVKVETTKPVAPAVKVEAPKPVISTPAVKVETTKPVINTPAVKVEAPVKKTVKVEEPVVVQSVVSTTATLADLPPYAKPGKCYARCLIPDQFDFREEKVVDRPASVRTQVIPAIYETVFDTVLVRAQSTRVEKIAAQYETVTEEVMVSPATSKWVKGKGNQNCLSQNPEDCQVMCLVEVPATYKTLTRKVLKSPAYDNEIIIPAETKIVPRKVLQTAERTVETEIPATYKTVMRKVLVKKGGYQEWREVMCDNNLTTERITSIQKALKERGYDPGPFDNVLGAQTRAALVKFQKDKGLPVGNLNFETLRELGVE